MRLFRVFLTTAMLMISQQTVLANEVKQGICARITGSWYGQFTFKDPRVCHQYHGCTHSLSIHVSVFDQMIYSAEVHPKVGQPGVYKIKCENGKITSLSHPNSVIEFNCPDNIVCAVKFNDDNIAAALMGSGIDYK